MEMKFGVEESNMEDSTTPDFTTSVQRDRKPQINIWVTEITAFALQAIWAVTLDEIQVLSTSVCLNLVP